MGLAHFMVTAAGGTPMEGLADDRCALDGSPCVHAGRINSGRYTESKIGPGAERDVVEPGSAPGAWVPLRRLVHDWWHERKKPDT